MRTLRYLHYDVFTDRAFEGNQLAVFPEPAGLTTEQMQTITREMNFSECTFIFPPETPGTGVRMRIFTPGEELPMAGHPTIGSTFALAKESVIAQGQRDFVFGLGVGPTPVSIDWENDDIDFVWMTQKNPEFGGAITNRAAFVQAIGLDVADLADTPPQQISCGNPFIVAAVKTRDAVDRVTLDPRAFSAVCRAAEVRDHGLFVFTTDRARSETTEAVYSRMLAPGLGVSEDPATGSASGPLGCYLHKYGLLPRERLTDFVSLQGVKMLRPSRLHVSIEGLDAVTRVRVGGRSVLIGEGSLTF
jgi:trans-2,3-dihydro-3-hydroxyanthranilate isomerase